MSIAAPEVPIDEPTPHAYPPASKGWAAVVVLSLLCVLSMLDRNILVLFADELSKDLGLTDVQLSLLFGGTFSFSYAIATLPIGAALDRFSRRRVIFFCVLIWSMSTMVCGLARTYAMMLVGRAGVGAGEAAMTPGASSILSDMFEPKRLSFPIGVYLASAKGGQSLSLIISALLTTLILPGATYYLGGFELRGWQLILVLIGAPGCLFAAAVFLIAEPPRRHRQSSQNNGYRAFFRYAMTHRRLFFSSYLGAMFYIAMTTAVISWSPVFLQRAHGMDVGESGFLLGGAFLVATVVGGPLHGLYVDRQIARGRADAHLRHLMRMGLLALPVGVGAYFAPGGELAAVLLGLFMFMISGFTNMTGTTTLLITPPELRAKAFAMLLMINSVIGMSVGPAFAAFLSEHVFHDRAAIGTALAIEIAVLVPAASICFAWALAPIRARLAELRVLER